jgi:hypothetical protein
MSLNHLTSPFVEQLANAPTLEAMPEVADPKSQAPLNPPGAIQQKFVGSSYLEAYSEAERFVDKAFESWPEGTSSDQTVLDFGSGWGRITRFLMRRFAAQQIWSSDVDVRMTALVHTTLPGVNAVTNLAMPPTAFRTDMFDAITAFSVFSHLSEVAHRRWAHEFGRVTRVGGKIYITVLEEQFLRQVASAQAALGAGTADAFATNLAEVVPDASTALEQFRHGTFIFGGGGNDGPRSQDFYGWAAAPRPWIEQTWASAGFRVESWIPTGELFQQAMIVLVREDTGTVGALNRELRTIAGKIRRRLRK